MRHRPLGVAAVNVAGRATSRPHGAGATLGARVLLEPREGPTGWRSVVATPAGGELALWRGKS